MTILNELTKVLMLVAAWMAAGFTIYFVTGMAMIFTRVPFDEAGDFALYWRKSGVPEEMETGNPISKIENVVTNLVLWPLTLIRMITTMEKCLKDWNRNRSL